METEVLLLYEQYIAGHPEIVSCFQPLFKKPKSDDAADDNDDPGMRSNEDEDPETDDDNDPGADNPGASKGKRIMPSIIPRYLPFQQAVMREKVKALSPEEDARVEDHIETNYAAAMKVWESPWLASAKPGQKVDDLQKKYYRKYVSQYSAAFQPSSHIFRNAERLCHTLQVAGEEIARQTGYNSFFLWGGPSTQMPGTVNVTAYVRVSFYVDSHNIFAASKTG